MGMTAPIEAAGRIVSTYRRMGIVTSEELAAWAVAAYLKAALERDVTLGEHPADTTKYSEGFCDECGRPLANGLAWDELDEGEGTNICWGECAFSVEGPTSQVLGRLLTELEEQ